MKKKDLNILVSNVVKIMKPQLANFCKDIIIVILVILILSFLLIFLIKDETIRIISIGIISYAGLIFFLVRLFKLRKVI